MVIIEYGVGNLRSILNMLKKVGISNCTISNQPDEIRSAQKLILPGVGHFDYGMTQLKASGLLEVLQKRVVEDKIPILGICLGAQLLTKGSEEGKEPGLGWINASTVRFDAQKLHNGYKIPHMGWSNVDVKKSSRLTEDLPEPCRFYFVHTYHIVCHNREDELMQCTYGYPFTAAVERGNVLGVQFHPEKSHKFGMRLLANFVNHY